MPRKKPEPTTRERLITLRDNQLVMLDHAKEEGDVKGFTALAAVHLRTLAQIDALPDPKVSRATRTEAKKASILQSSGASKQ